jgi:hypothetical protein
MRFQEEFPVEGSLFNFQLHIKVYSNIRGLMIQVVILRYRKDLSGPTETRHINKQLKN